MGAKIEFCYLSNKCNKDILVHAINTVANMGWTYNMYVPGEYTYWIDGPIWEFGESKTHRESSLMVNYDHSVIEKIIDKISQYYSPTIKLGTNWFQKKIGASLNIIEFETGWKEICFTVDRFEVLDSLERPIREEAKSRLLELFTNLVSSVKPYYGIGGTELAGVVSDPAELFLDEMNLGDFNYFSSDVVRKLNLDKLKKDFTITHVQGGAILVCPKKGLLELG